MTVFHTGLVAYGSFFLFCLCKSLVSCEKVKVEPSIPKQRKSTVSEDTIVMAWMVEN